MANSNPALPAGMDWYPETVDASVHLNAAQQDVLLNGGDAAVDALIQQLQQNGMQNLALNGDQLAAMADNGVTLSNVHVTVQGTSFLSHDGAHDLLAGATVDVNVNWSDMSRLAVDAAGNVAPGGEAQLHALVQALQDAGGTLNLDGGQVTQFARLDYTLNAGADVVINGTDFVTDPYAASLEQVQQLLNGADVTVKFAAADLSADLLQSLAQAGVDHLQMATGWSDVQIGDDLASALADADAQFLQNGDGVIVVAAAADVGNVAYVAASLEDLQHLGVADVQAGAGVETVEIALRDADVTGAFTLADLPQFDVQPGTEVALVVDQDDLAALLANSNVFDTLYADGVTAIHYVGDANAAPADLADQLASAGLSLDTTALTPTEVELLGLADPLHPLTVDPQNQG